MNRRHLLLTLVTSLTATANPAPAQDTRLLGRWVHQSMINSSGGAGGFASFSTERSIEFQAPTW